MRQIHKRLLASAGFISVAAYTIFFAPRWFFFIFVEVFILLGLNEFLSLAEKKGVTIHRILTLTFGALVPFSVFFHSDSVILMLAMLAVLVMHFKPSLRDQALISTAVMVFGILYVAWFCSYLIKMRYLNHGGWWVFYTILLVKGGDAGAYFVGKNYGKIKLIEHISPNKSVEGAVGGFLTTVALSLLSFIYLPHIPFVHLLVLGILTGLLAQLGDLAESVMKRDAGVKDSGAVPGLGGILDILDSLILTIPFIYYYITIVLGEMI